MVVTTSTWSTTTSIWSTDVHYPFACILFLRTWWGEGINPVPRPECTYVQGEWQFGISVVQSIHFHSAMVLSLRSHFIIVAAENKHLQYCMGIHVMKVNQRCKKDRKEKKKGHVFTGGRGPSREACRNLVI